MTPQIYLAFRAQDGLASAKQCATLVASSFLVLLTGKARIRWQPDTRFGSWDQMRFIAQAWLQK